MPLENGSPTGTFTASVIVTAPVDNKFHALENKRMEEVTVVIYQVECTMLEAKTFAEMIKSKNGGRIVTAWTGLQEI